MAGRERPTTSCLLGQEAQCRFHSDDLSFHYFISRGPEFPYDLRDKLSTLVIFILGFQSIRPGSRCGLLSHARSHRLFALNACLPHFASFTQREWRSSRMELCQTHSWDWTQAAGILFQISGVIYLFIHTFIHTSSIHSFLHSTNTYWTSIMYRKIPLWLKRPTLEPN